MDEIRESIVSKHKLNEKIMKDAEEDEARTNEKMEAIHRQSQSHKPSFGPANDLLRFLYILEQQAQKDSDEIRTKARESVLEYIAQFQSTMEEDDDDPEPELPNDLPSPAPIIIPNPQPPKLADLPPVIPPLHQAASVVPPSSAASPTLHQPASFVPALHQPASVVPALHQPASVIPPSSVASPTLHQSATSVSASPVLSLSPVTDRDHIRPETLVAYEKLLSEAKQYEDRYNTINESRRNQLRGPVRRILNQLRKETYGTLSNELFQYLNGQPVEVAGSMISIATDEEHLLCLSLLAKLILLQLLEGDLTDIKAEILLPLIADISRNPRHKEFRTIFLDCLHKKCPYTVPLYPQRRPDMTDDDYSKAMGYIVKTEGDKNRFETDEEFLNRMSGLIRLFCKLLVDPKLRFDPDLTLSWSWCADILNLPSRPNLTALLLRVFLDEGGPLMMKAYPKQFPKIVEAIQANQGKITQNTSPSERTRLEQEVKKFLPNKSK